MKSVNTIATVFATYVLLASTTAQFAGAAPIAVDFLSVVDKPLDPPIILEEGFVSQGTAGTVKRGDGFISNWALDQDCPPEGCPSGRKRGGYISPGALGKDCQACDGSCVGHCIKNDGGPHT
ncbi:unnamed protein product [Tilletia laevis]|uniref:Uncharacterized protein n=2 Tax=Tilletia TaxID=13289 RepID=A0A177TZB7_9BASI|nr:hypothetical protein CF336_g7548 [Tilletia laevis]KAE8247645.1 hypothetical protein A4X03_0g6992 [Tilletia caries]CAD6968776.1 unnamed protein product [Tilletia controversa]KAE8187457.1 hypothetical protein CF335_g7167 [Tilletia laevis]CAD6889289.1 unnamed protein product [Tilletia caries]